MRLDGDGGLALTFAEQVPVCVLLGVFRKGLVQDRGRGHVDVDAVVLCSRLDPLVRLSLEALGLGIPMR